jgi:3-oxoacyl-ACP reductase-like protein
VIKRTSTYQTELTGDLKNMVTFSLKDKIALITGASRGIGEEIAHTLAENGAHCILVSRKIGRAHV